MNYFALAQYLTASKQDLLLYEIIIKIFDSCGLQLSMTPCSLEGCHCWTVGSQHHILHHPLINLFRCVCYELMINKFILCSTAPFL